MDIRPKTGSYAHCFKTIDSHTVGEATRIIYEGFPELPGSTMMEKKKYLEKNYDHYRTALMLEPRGHRDMFGALITEPVNPEADLGVVFMDSGGYLNMCGHGSIGTASMAVETGLVAVTEPYTEVVLDTPSGIIRAKVRVEGGKAVEVSILNVPSFLYRENLKAEIPGYGTIPYDISFGGSFFALVDAEAIGLDLKAKYIEEITELGMKLRNRINKEVNIRHPYLDITTVDLVEFYTSADHPQADLKNCVIFGQAQADRSPCGTGTSAKIAALYAKGELGLNQKFVYESMIGSIFKGEAVQELEISGIKAIIPQITGSAYITGMNQWILDDDDPLEDGFLLGNVKKAEPESIRTRIVRAAWKLFREKGFPETRTADVIGLAGVSADEFHSAFETKEDLLDTLGDFFDQKYAELMLEMNPRLNHYEQLLYLNRELFRLIETEVPFNLVVFLYTQDVEKKKKSLFNEERLYFKLIMRILQEGRKSGEFKNSDSVQSMAEIYASLERGMIYNWCVAGGAYSLTGNSQSLLPIYLKEFLR